MYQREIVIRIPPPYVDLQALADFNSNEHFLVYADQQVVDQEELENVRALIERQKTVMGPDFRKFLGELKDRLVDRSLPSQR